MAINLINVGQVANDGTGDDLREAMIKINQNFEELDLATATVGTNLGNTGEGVFYASANNTLQFKSLVAGTNINLVSDANTITFNVPDAISQLTVTGDSGNTTTLEGDAVLTVEGGPGISTRIVNGNLVINNDYIADISEDTTPELGGDLNANNFNIVNVGTINGFDPDTAASLTTDIDLGSLNYVITNNVEYLIAVAADLDLGTLTDPSPFIIDLGNI